MATSIPTPTNPHPPIPAYKAQFLQSCLSANVLTFGTYTLKSGRHSPYFFNAGSFHTGALLSAISTAYAHTIISFLASHPSIPKPDILFGPSYKGIPIASTALLALHALEPETYATTSYSFNRKEAKPHGEGGCIVGAPLRGKNILVLDDVITAGTALRETATLIASEGGTIVGFIVALDRGEKMPRPARGNEKVNPKPLDDDDDDDDEADNEPRMSAMGQIREEYSVPTASIATLDDLITLLRTQMQSQDQGPSEDDNIARLEDYRRRYMPIDT